VHIEINGFFLLKNYNFLYLLLFSFIISRISFGIESLYLRNVRDLSRKEFFVLFPLVFLTILFGLFPNIILDTLHFSVSSFFFSNFPPLLTLFPSILYYKNSNPSNSYDFFIVPIKSYLNINTQREEILKENKNLFGIYRWINLVNGKSYISSAIDLSKRLNEHYRGQRSNIPLQRALN